MIEGAPAAAAVVEPPGLYVEYPEGPRVPEGDLQTRRRGEIVCALRHWLADRPGAWVLNDINVYWVRGDNTTSVAPDVAVAFGVAVDQVAGRPVYKVWEAGAAPCFALEIASHTTYKRDLEEKPEIFAELGVGEYWRLDPTGGEYFEPALQGDRRRAGRWETVPVAADTRGGLVGRSAALGLELHWQPPKLRFYDPAAGAWLLDYDDQNRARQTAETRAEAAETRAEAAEARRRALEAELAALRRGDRDAPSAGGRG